MFSELTRRFNGVLFKDMNQCTLSANILKVLAEKYNLTPN